MDNNISIGEERKLNYLQEYKTEPTNEIVVGDLNNKPVTKIKKPILVALFILGAAGAVVLAVGLATYGGHSNWWQIGNLVNLTKASGIVMVSLGSTGALVFTTAGIVGVVVNSRQKQQNQPNVPNVIAHELVESNVKNATSEEDALYRHDDKSRILDLAYVSKDKGFGCVVDGTGHNDPNMREKLKKHFDPFIENYADGLSQINTLEGLIEYFTQQIGSLENQFRDPNLEQNQVKVCSNFYLHQAEEKDRLGSYGTFLEDTFKPAMSFVQLVPLEGKLLLLTAQASDTTIIVQKQDELFAVPHSPGVGVGHKGSDTKVKIFDITGAKKVIGFSDGIADFLTLNELMDIVPNTETDQLFATMKNTITTRIENPKGSSVTGAITGYNNGVHTYDPNYDPNKIFDRYLDPNDYDPNKHYKTREEKKQADKTIDDLGFFALEL